MNANAFENLRVLPGEKGNAGGNRAKGRQPARSKN
jgi:hypothetical protein